MKKKIVALCLVVALALTAIGGATLAYFTDNDQVNNTFTIGDLQIDLYEKTDIDGDGRLEDQEFQEYLEYSNIMPGDALPKQAHIRNESDKNAAYVRVAVVMNNVMAINDAIDNVYEEKTNPQTNAVYTADEIQAIYDNVFEGWGVNYSKRAEGGRRMWMDSRVGEGSPVLFNIDTYAQLDDATWAYYGMFDIMNKFQSDLEKWRVLNDLDENDKPEGFIYGDDECSYYSCIEDDERIYVFYLKLEAGEDYTLFEGLNAPADFNATQMAMFDGLKIGIYADAIQVDNFDTAEDAFNALEAEHPLGWWN